MLATIVQFTVHALTVVIALEALFIWFPSARKKEPTVSSVVGKIAGPLTKPYKACIWRLKNKKKLDISPIVAIAVIQLIGALLTWIIL